MSVRKIVIVMTALFATSAFAQRHGQNDFELKNEIRQLANQIENATRRTHADRYELRQVVNTLNAALQTLTSRPLPPLPPRPPVFQASVSCKLDIGGNFFVPKTMVMCDVYGTGATAWEIHVNGIRMWNGGLNAGRANQYFETDKKKVGGYAVQYDVYLISKSGQKKLAATLNPR